MYRSGIKEEHAMKKYLTLIICSCLLLLTGVVFVACSSDDDGDQQPQVYNVTVEAVLSSDAVTRALSGDGSSDISTVWAKGEVVHVSKLGTSLGTLAPQSFGSASAKLIGTLSGAKLAVNDELVLTYLKSPAVYSGQEGTLSNIGANFAIAKATVTITEISGGIVKTGKATFTSQQAIVKFSLKGETNEPLNASQLDIKYGSTTLSLTDISDATYTTNGDGVLYVAVPAFDSQLLTLTATVGDNTYKYEKPAVSFENGKYYPVGVRMGKYENYTAKDHYLTLQALNDGTTITFDNKAAGVVKYSTNGSNWTDIGANSLGKISSLSAGTKVYFKGTNATYTIQGTDDPETPDIPSHISCSRPCYVYGNFMSLIGGDDFAATKSLTGYSALSNLFDGNVNIRNHPYKDMVLPAKSLSNYCYFRMFCGCTGLSRSPIMAAASSLPSGGYANMFNGCTSLYYIKCFSAIDNGSDTYDFWVNNVPAYTFGTFVTQADNVSGWSDRRTSSGVPVNWTVKSSE